MKTIDELFCVQCLRSSRKDHYTMRTTTHSKFDPNRFSDEEFQKELELQHIKSGKGGAARGIYMSQAKKLLQQPKSGVFRDFVQHGVYPVRVHILYFNLTIPFLAKFMSAEHVKNEILNQIREKEKRKEVSKEYRNVKPYIIKEYPTVGECYTLISIIKDRKQYRPYTSSLQWYMTLCNSLSYFGLSDLRKNLQIKKDGIKRLTQLIPQNILNEEIKAQSRRNPDMWGQSSMPTQEDSKLLIEDLTINTPLTNLMREVMKHTKRVTSRHELYNILEKLNEMRRHILPVVRIVISNKSL